MNNICEIVEKSKLTFWRLKENPENTQRVLKELRKNLKLLRKISQKKSIITGRKNQAICAIGILSSFRAKIKHMQMLKNISNHSSRRLKCEYIESAFQNRIKTLIINNLSHIDPADFMDDCEKAFRIRIRKILKHDIAIKVNGIFCGEFKILKEGQDELEFKYMNTKNHIIYNDTDISNWFMKNIKNKILKDIEEFQEKQSGWSIYAIINLTMNINKFTPQLGSSFINLPYQVQKKNACINVNNNDNACFAWAILSAIYPVEKDPQRTAKYQKYFNNLQLKGIQFPMTINQISRFEKQNEISINVYILKLLKIEKFETFITLPTYLTKNKKDQHVNLLLIQNDYSNDDIENKSTTKNIINEPIKYHYVWIKDLSRLLSSQLGKRSGKKHFCDRCLHFYHTLEKLEEHTENCAKQNNCKIRLPSKENKFVEFKNFKNKISAPFIIYADLECILKKVEDGKKYQDHEPCSIGYYMKCSYDNKLTYYNAFRGENCVSWFSKELQKISKKLDNILSNPISMDNLTENEIDLFNTVCICHICEKLFTDEDQRVRDHCHFTGKYRGAAHNSCNINYQDGHTVPIVFHNLSGYDSHFLIENIASDMPGRVDLLPINKEKYIAFTKHLDFQLTKFRFIDSFRFMDKSLNELSSYLSAFPNLKSQFLNISDTQFSLLNKKGIYPYDYCDNSNKFMETSLPSFKNFYNKLNDCNVSPEDYAHACNVWKEFDIKNLGDYSDLYLKTDVLLLADVFEQFRASCLKTYNLDPSHYFTLPGFTWDSMLKYTSIKLELLTDIDMLMFIERGIRGGLSQCSNRYSKANNKYISGYDPSQPSTYLMYFDINNQYGWAMSQHLPYGGFKWLENIVNFDVNQISDESEEGYILEVDIEYPNELHDIHNDLPFCTEHQCSPGTKEEKLMATLNNKNKYVIHYRNLKQALKNGLKLTKIHKILKFNQSKWLKSYIDLNTHLRTLATNSFEKNLFKLMNNAVFGKTMENVRKHSIVKLVTQWFGRYGAEAYISKPEFKASSIFNENLVAIELNKTEIFFNKPIYIGMCILDLAKTTLYNFHYDYMIPKFNKNCKICYTDTDSLIYQITCDNIYEIIKLDCHSHFDTSDYPVNNIWNIPLVNKKVPGVMKDENNGTIMTEFVGLRSKMYAYKIKGETNDIENKKAKGVKKQVVQCRIRFEDYTTCLNKEKVKVITQNLIQSKKHSVSSITQTKSALNPHDDKRYLIKGNCDTLAWGHHKIMEIN